jgi:very-short-patch-repair endonuclease
MTAEEIFAEQYSVASRGQLLVELSDDQINGLLRRGRLVKRYWGVYHPPGVTLCGRGEALAALLRCPDGAAITGPLSLGLLGVDGFSDADPFDVLLPPGTRVRGVDFRARPNPSPDCNRTLGKLTLAAPARCLIDSARPAFGLSDEQLWTGYDSARWRNVLSTHRFLRELERSSARDPGAVRWRRMGDERSLRAESPKERGLDEILRRFDPAPELQVWVLPKRRVDFFWRRIRLAIEYLGKGSHGYEQGRLSDVVRDDELERVGVRSVFVINEDLREPDALVAWLLAAAQKRAAELGVAAPVLRPE